MDLSRLRDALFAVRDAFADVGARFERRRRWTPRLVAMALVVLASDRSISSLEKLMAVMSNLEGWASPPSDSTFVDARKSLVKLRPRALVEVWQRLSAQALALIPANRRTLGGLHWLAIDGTWVWTPRSSSTVAKFGRPKTKDGKLHYPQALLVTALDVMTRIPMACGVSGHASSERDLLRGFLDQFKPGMVAMMDRGFPAKELLRQIIERKADVVWRMGSADANSWNCVYDFLHDRTKPLERVVDLVLPGLKPGDAPTTVPVRLIRRRFAPGRPKAGQTRETMVLMTTLLDAATWTPARLVSVYERRWAIETWFRDVKVGCDLERFHSTTADGVEQEIHALMVWMTITGLIERDAYHRVERSRGKQDPEDPTRFQINHSNVAFVAANLLTRIVAGEQLDRIIATSERDLEWISQTARRRRPGRSAPRVRKAPHGRWNG